MKRVSSIAKFWAKTTTFGQRSKDVLTTFNDDPDLLKKAITGDESWVYGYATETSPIIPMEAFRRAKTEKRVKFSQM